MDREEGVRKARSAGHELGEPFYLDLCCEDCTDPEAHACVHCHALLAVVPATGEVDEVYTEPAVFGWCPARRRLSAWRAKEDAHDRADSEGS